MFVEDERKNNTYRGINPKFYHKVMRDREAKILALERENKRLLEEKVLNTKVASLDSYREIVVKGGSGLNSRVSARQTIATVAASHFLPVADLIGECRSVDVVQVRHQAIRAVADARPDMSAAAIGRLFNRDHTTILHSLKKTRKPGQAR